VRRSGRSSDQEVSENIFKVRKKKVFTALYWFVEHNILYQQFKVIIDPSNLDWMGDDEECTLPTTCTIKIQDDDTPEDDGIRSYMGPSPDQNLMDQLDKIEGVDFEVSGTLGTTDCTIPTIEDAEILDEIRNSGAGNDKGTPLNWPSSDIHFRV
jgi:hypothetical protein